MVTFVAGHGEAFNVVILNTQQYLQLGLPIPLRSIGSRLR